MIISIMVLMCLSSISLLEVSSFQVAKRLFSYASVIVIPFAVNKIESSFFDTEFECIAKSSILVWCLIGAVQILFRRDFMSQFVPLMRSSATRGVCGLASEPSFYGYMCFLFFLFAMDFNSHRIIFMLLCTIQAFFFAQSSVTIVYFIVLSITYSSAILTTMKATSIAKIIAITLSMVAIITVVQIEMPNSRMAYLITKLLSSLGSNDTPVDQSVQQRVNAIIFSFSRMGLPYFVGTRQIMSGFGGMVYEMGFFSLLIIVPILKTIRNAHPSAEGIGIVLAVAICMFSAIQLSSPLFAYYIGYCSHRCMRISLTTGSMNEANRL